MINTICLDENYSTTRLLTKEKPIVINNPEDKFESMLFLPESEGRKGEGGLRTKGYFKKSYEDKPLISIVTVVFNGGEFLEETILSVINQTYDNVEYIIIDGGSNDGTVDIIKKYEDKIDYWVSEKDGGIYNAMNKGIDVVNGDWMNFMNAGDSFYNKNIIETIANNMEDEDTVVSGKVNIYYKNRFIQEYGNKKIVPHQAAFFKSSYMKRLYFNLDYKILADGDMLQRLQRLQNYRIKYVNIVVSKFYLGGIGNNPKYLFRRMKEELKIKQSYNQGISFKWIILQGYNFFGLLFYCLFGEYRYYTVFQNIILKLVKN